MDQFVTGPWQQFAKARPLGKKIKGDEKSLKSLQPGKRLDGNNWAGGGRQGSRP